MKQGTKQEFYASPEVEVIEVKVRQIICESSNKDAENDGYHSTYYTW